MFDCDHLIIGSGFGGSVSALRLTEKGNHVIVLEKGRRREDNEFPDTNWDFKNYVWEPKLGLKGSIQFSVTSKVGIIHGIGVGGGSQVYANVHFIPQKKTFDSPSWSRIRDDWYDQLMPYYSLAQRMLGTTQSEYENIADHTLKAVADDLGRGDSYRCVATGVVFPQEDGVRDKKIPDPYFNGDGPDRVTCQYCAACGLGCRHNAKNTLMKNYLYFAERNGAEIRADSEVTRIEPIEQDGKKNGSAGYRVTIEESKEGSSKRTYSLTTRGVVVSAGVMGTVPLLMKMRDQEKTLPDISPWLGQQIRTNSETLTTANNLDTEVNEGITISSFFSADDTTNIEVNRFGDKMDAAWFILPYVPMVTGTGFTRILKFLGNTLLHPVKTMKVLWPKGKAKSSILFLIMQSGEAFIHFEWRRRWYRLFRKDITAVQKPGDEHLTVSFPAAEEATRMYAEKLGGEPGSSLAEIMLGIPITAHIMSGVAIGKDAQNGVIDESGEVFGYKNLRVLDGSIIPGNLGVNPALTITALSEYCMSRIPVFDQQKADAVESIQFSDPVHNQVSVLSNEEAEKLIKLVPAG